MPRFLSDEHIRKAVLRGVWQYLPELDLMRVHDVGLLATPDDRILAWAADAGRVVVTHDTDTMPGFAYRRLADGLPMAGLVVVSDQLSIGRVIEELTLLIVGLREDEWEGRVHFLPL